MNSVVPRQPIDVLRNRVPFDALPESSLQEICDGSSIHALKHGDSIVRNATASGKSLYVVLAGRVRLKDSHRQISARYRQKGEAFGHRAILQNVPDGDIIECVRSGVLLDIPEALVQRLFERHPRFVAWFDADLRRRERDLGMLDDTAGNQFLFGQRLGHLQLRPEITCEETQPIMDVARIMQERHSDCAIIMRGMDPVGIVSDADLRNQVVAAGRPFTEPVSEIMNTDLLTIRARASVYEGMMALEQRGWHHLILLDDQGNYKGVLSDSDIARTLMASPTALRERLAQASSAAHLKELRTLADETIVTLYRRGVRADDLLRINSGFNDALTQQAITISRQAIGESPSGLRWCWLALGSEGRGEMGLRTDQDNAIVYECTDISAADAWLKALAEQTNALLDNAGIAYCEAGIMARESAMRHDLDGWCKAIAGWVEDSDGLNLYRVTALSDCRAVTGDESLCEQLKQCLLESRAVQTSFLRQQAQEALAINLPVQRFLGLRLRGNRGKHGRTLNVKQQGMMLVVNAARLFCLESGWLEQSATVDRLAHVAATDSELRETAMEALVAIRVLTDLRLGWHVEQLLQGEKPSDSMPLNQIGETRKRLLVGVFRTIEEIQFRVASRYGIVD